MLATSLPTGPQQRRRNSRSGPQPKPPTVTDAIHAHLPRLSRTECASIGPILVSVGLELLSRLRPNIASSTFASVTSLIADWLEGLAAADQESLDRIRGTSGVGANCQGATRDSKYFNDAYQVYPAWWGHEEALPSTLPAVATSAVELLAKWNLRGAVIESAARTVDQESSAIGSVDGPRSSSPRKFSRTATVPPPWAARRMVDEFIQTDPASPPDTDAANDHEHDNPDRNHVRRTRFASRSPPARSQPTHRARPSASPAAAPDRRRSPSASRRPEPAAEKGGFFFLPMDTAAASTRRPVAPLNLVRRSQQGQSKPSSNTQARAGATSSKPTFRQQQPASTASAAATSTAPPPKPTHARAPQTHLRPSSPVKPPTSFTVPAVGSIFPVDSDKVQRMVSVAQSALADDFCAIFSSDDGEDDTSTGGNTTESVDAVRFPSKMTSEVDRKREVRSRDARMGVGRVWYKKEWAERDRAEVDADQGGAGDKRKGEEGDEREGYVEA